MPCYTVKTVSLEFNGSNMKLIEEAARIMKWKIMVRDNIVYVGPMRIDLDRKTAETTAQNGQEVINSFKRAYSEAAVKAASKIHGWTMQSWKQSGKARTTVATKY